MWDQIKSYLGDLFTLALAFMSPLVGVFIAMICFVVFDAITGILKARKLAGDIAKEQNKTKKEILKAKRDSTKSRKLGHSVAKFIFYFAGILLGAITNHFLELEMPVEKMVLGFIILIELKSIDENMQEVLGYSIFGRVLDLIKRKDPNDDKE